MTTSKCFAWRWLPGATQPVVAGELQCDDKGRQAFVYGRSYLDRSDAEPIYEPELPLLPGVHEPINGLDHFSCLRDAAPDAWGRRVIDNRIFGRGEIDASRRLNESIYPVRRRGHDPRAYFEWVFDRLMRDPDPENPRDLLPAAWIEQREASASGRKAA